MIMKVNFKSTVLLFVAALFFLSCETPSNGNVDDPAPPVVEEDDDEVDVPFEDDPTLMTIANFEN